MDQQPLAVGVRDQVGRRAGRAGAGVTRQDEVLVRPDPVGVARHPVQAGRGDEVGVRPVVALRDEVRGRPGGVHELDQRQVGAPVELTQVGRLEGLDEDLGAAVVEVVALQGREHRLLEREADRVEVRRVLGLRVDPDPAAGAPRLLLGQVQHLVEGGDPELAVVARVVGPHLGQPLLRPQRLELGVGEVLGEPAGDLLAVDRLRGLAVGELRVVGDVGRAGDVVLVAGDEHPVLGRDEVGLDVVGAHPDGEAVRRQRVLGAVAGGAAVADHDRLGVVQLVGLVGGGGGSGRRGDGEDRGREAEADGGRDPREGRHAVSETAGDDRPAGGG